MNDLSIRACKFLVEKQIEKGSDGFSCSTDAGYCTDISWKEVMDDLNFSSEDAISRLHLQITLMDLGIDHIQCNDGRELCQIIDEEPSVNPIISEKVGKWIFHKSFDNGHKNCNECIECSQCHTWLGHDCYAKTPYCPMCGCRMEEGE